MAGAKGERTTLQVAGREVAITNPGKIYFLNIQKIGTGYTLGDIWAPQLCDHESTPPDHITHPPDLDTRRPRP